MEEFVSSLTMLSTAVYIFLGIGLPSAVGVVMDTTECRGTKDCGWNSYCEHGQCWCVSGYQKSLKGANCLDGLCSVAGCVECADTATCRRCEGFIDAESGQCLEKCENDYSLVIKGAKVGKVCQGSPPGLSMVYIAIIVAALASTMIAVLISLIINCRLRSNKKQALQKQLMAEILKVEKKSTSAKTEQFTGSDNVSYASVEEADRLRRLHYYHQVAVLRPHMDSFLVMLRDAKVKCHSLGAENWRQLMYRNLTHQLCRVLTVLNDRTMSMPADGNLLLDWAHRLLKDYLAATRQVSVPASPPLSLGRDSTSPQSSLEQRSSQVRNGSVLTDSPAPMENGGHRNGSVLTDSGVHMENSELSIVREESQEMSEITGPNSYQRLEEPIQV